MTENTTPQRIPGLLVGAFLCLGWVVHDLTRYVTSGRPASALDILPGSLLAVVIGAVVGWLCGRSLLLWALLCLATVVGSGLPAVTDLEVSRATMWLPRCAFLLLIGFIVVVALQHMARPGWARTAFAVGLLICIGKTAFRHGTREMSFALLTVGVVCLLLGLWRKPVPRVALTALALLGGIGSYVPRILEDLSPTRADLAPQTAAATGPNLVFIVMDTVRADHLSAYGYERDTTPSLDAFAKEHATLYTACRSTSPFTLPSHSSMFTGLFPSEHHAALPGISAQPMREDVPTLAGTLREAGFQTSAIVANDTYLNPIFNLDRGFEHFDDRAGGWTAKYLALAQLGGGDALRVGHLNQREATEITDTAVEWIDEERRDGPFFLFLNYLDAHSPYHPNENFRSLFSEEKPTDPMNPPGPMRLLLYDRELAYVDSEIGRLFDELRARNLFDDTCIIVTADHGEDFLEHNIIEHCWSLYDSLVHVPLFLKPAGGRRETVNESKISVAQLFDMALDEAGVGSQRTFPDHGFIGEWYPTDPVSDSYSPWAERTGFEINANRVAWLEGETKWIVSSTGEVLAFDLAADPDEKQPLDVGEAERGTAIDRANAWWKERPLPQPGETGIDEDTKAQLEALGYG